MVFVGELILPEVIQVLGRVWRATCCRSLGVRSGSEILKYYLIYICLKIILIVAKFVYLSHYSSSDGIILILIQIVVPKI